MSTIQEFSYLRVPEKSSINKMGSSTDLPGVGLITPIAYAIKLSEHFTGWEYFNDASTVLSNISQGYRFGEWINGNKDMSPFQEKEIITIKENCSSLWKQFSTSIFAQTVVRTVLITNSYLSDLSLLKSSDSSLFKIPYWDTIVPVAKLYNGIQKTLSGITKIHTKDHDTNPKSGYGTLLSGAADSLSASARIVGSFLIYQVSPLTQLALSILSYVGSIFELSHDDKIHKMEQIDEIAQAKQTVMIPI